MHGQTDGERDRRDKWTDRGIKVRKGKRLERGSRGRWKDGWTEDRQTERWEDQDKKTDKRMYQGLDREMARLRKKGWTERQTGIQKGPKVRMGKGQCPAVRTDGRDHGRRRRSPFNRPPAGGRRCTPVRPRRARDNGVGAGSLWARVGGGQEVSCGRAPSCSPIPRPSPRGHS